MNISICGGTIQYVECKDGSQNLFIDGMINKQWL